MKEVSGKWIMPQLDESPIITIKVRETSGEYVFKKSVVGMVNVLECQCNSKKRKREED